MANEYKLNYTASEINERLAMVDIQPDWLQDNKNQPDYIKNKPEVTTEVTENSDSIITSGGVYEALQNIDVGGNVELIAGDGIEIKNGIIRSTLGDYIGTEMIETTNEILSIQGVEMEQEDDKLYLAYGEIDELPSENTLLKMNFTLSGEDVPMCYEAVLETVPVDIPALTACHNCIFSVDDGFIVTDENSFAVCVLVINEAGDNYVTIYTNEDYTGATISIETFAIEQRESYARLPENALSTGNLIEIKDGVIRSTLGDTLVGSEVLTEIFNEQNMVMEFDGDSMSFYYSDQISITELPSVGTVFDVQLVKSGETTPTCYVSTYESVDGDVSVAFCNMSLDNNGEPQIVDDSLPAFYIMPINEDGTFLIEVVFFNGDYNGASMTISTPQIEKSYVRLPEHALDAGNLIEIKDGVVSCTLGEVSPENSTNFLYDSKLKAGVSGSVYVQSTSYDFAPEGGSEVEIKIEKMPGFGELITYNNISVSSPTNVFGDMRLVFVNTSQTDYNEILSNGFIKEDDNLPAFVIRWLWDSDYYKVYIISSDDFTNASIKVYKDGYIKLPNTALTFDSIPTEGSENLVTSGVVYEAIQNDTSELTGKIEELTGNIEELTGKMIGENGDGYGSEIFNDYGNNVASGSYSHAEGFYTTASGDYSHAEGRNTTASGSYSHAEGRNTTASGSYSHAEGRNTTASGSYSHAEGFYTTASGDYSHAEGRNTTASGSYSHAEGEYILASSNYQHVQGKSNIEDTSGKYAHIVGNGDLTTRSNAHTLDWNGNAWYAGNIYVGGSGQDDSSAVRVATVNDLKNIGDGDGNVISVNGKTGIVTLTAEDVGALPDTVNIPTVPTDISAFNNDIGYITEHQSLAEYAKLSDIENKQDKLIFDSAPTEGSENLVKSGDIYTAIQNTNSTGGASNVNNTIRIPKFEDIDNERFRDNMSVCLDSWVRASANGEVVYGSMSTTDTDYMATRINPMLYASRDNGQFTNTYRDIWSEAKAGGQRSVNCITFCNMMLMGIPYNYCRLNGHENVIGAAGYGFDICKLVNGTISGTPYQTALDVTYNPNQKLDITTF